MSHEKRVSRSSNLAIIKIVGIYAFAGGLWIYTSDSLLAIITHDQVLLKEIAVLKGLVFIALTSLLLYSLITRYLSQLQKTETSLHTTEMLYQLISENSADVIWMMDITTGRFTYVSPSVKRLRGYTAEEVMQQPVEQSLTPESYRFITEQLPVRIKAFLNGDEQARINISEVDQPCKDGSTVPTEVVTTLLTDATNNATTILGVTRDISRRKNAEQARRQTEERYKRLYESMRDGFASVSLEGSFKETNEAYRQMVGYSTEELSRMMYEDLTPVQWHAAEQKIIDEQVLRRGYSDTYEKEYRTKDGRIIPVELRSFLLKDEAGNIDGMWAFIRDISERKKVERALRESEEHYRELYEQSPLGYQSLDADGKFLLVNQAWLDTLGYSQEEIIGRWFGDLLAPEYVEAFKQRFPRFKAAGKIHSEFEMLHKNGTRRYVGFDGRIAHDLAGGFKQTHCILQDISERKQADDLLRQSEERFKAAFMTTPDSININRLADGQYISINNGFTRIMGYTEADVVDKSSLELNIWAHPEDRTKLVAGLRRDGKVENMEAQFRAKDGTVRIGLMSASLIQLNNEPHIISITRDITELKRLQDELLQAEKMLSIGTLAGGIAHDFNNILNIILGYSTMLEKRRLDEQKFSESVAAITSAVDRGSALVRQILTFARKTDTAFKPLYIPDLIHELFSMLKQTFPKTISFNEKMETSLPFIYGDPSQLHQVFLNLCVNARDAMPHGGAITIRVKTWTSAQLHERFPDAVHDRYMCMSIEDTGIGMDEITRTRIFDPFFTTKESGKGTGLGLAVAYGIVQTHNGFIDVYSVQGIGTKFDIYLPVSTDVQQPQLSSASNATSNAIHGTETILIVEDEDFLLKILGSVLESHGYTVISAQDGETAVKLYQERRQEIDLVLTDMGLPKISGRDEFNMLKAINPQVNVIIASGFLEPEIKTELAAAGVREFIQKPYRPEELMQTLRQVLDSTHQKGQQP